MSAMQHKKLMQDIFAELSRGNSQPFLEAMAEDMKWIWMGSGQWSHTFDGKEAIIHDLWGAVSKTLVPPFKVIARHIIADEDQVVIESTGQNRTPDGKEYQNKYCWVCQFRDGKICELREYMDTELVTSTFRAQNS